MHKIICSFLLSISVVFSLITAHASADTGTHIIINQVYGGGASADRTAPVSHSFVELYNPTDNTVDLSGWSVQYCNEGSSWSVFPLEGTIEPKHSYLIRGALHNSSARLQIDKYDAVWSTAFNNKGLKILLKNNTLASRSKNPYESNETGYVDMVGVAGNEYYYFIDGYETDYSQIQSKQKAIRRTKFTDTDNNAKDFSAIDYRTADLNEVRPRCSSDGAWTYTEFERSKGITKIPLEEKNTEFSFLHLSDTQASTAGQFAVWGKLTAAIADEDYDFSVLTGDFTDNPNNRAEMDMFYEYSGALMQKPFIPVIGNHDKKNRDKYRSVFGIFFRNAGNAGSLSRRKKHNRFL